ncbi:alkaline phosphatase family protein [Streptosporangiaceae bacterium NEAU-GS5]|nr:alkaline phosphatase family protein [Streptosporangiaceae bacterium NEAU-GS5]
METSAPCAVTVATVDARAEEHTFTVHGHHYVVLDLPVHSSVPYWVELDGAEVWPVPGFPPSVVRPLDSLRTFVFGSCRRVGPAGGEDALSAYAVGRAGAGELPDLLLMLGDQVYADELTPDMIAYIRKHRDDGPDEVVSFDEYAELYRQAWSDPTVRWLMSTVPTLMIFDDHDIRDDWNTSLAWREKMAQVPWWPRRIVSGLGSYYVYQHLGNLPKHLRDADPILAALKAGDGDERLDEFAARADADPGSARWSYYQDFGRTRLLMADSRAGRLLEPGKRRILGDWDWFEQTASADVDTLVMGSSLPAMLPSLIHHAERWNEWACENRVVGRAAEWLRQFLDLEHWAAFRWSFDDLARILTSAPARRILLLSGDVHYSYLATVKGRPIHQLVCSPIRNPLGAPLRWANAFAAALAFLTHMIKSSLRWKIWRGPWFGNMVTAVELTPEQTSVTWLGSGAPVGSQVL